MAFVPVYILILLLTIIIDYFAGILIENAAEERKKWFLVMSIVANVGVLAFFKYYNFIAENLNALFHVSNMAANIPLLKIILPIGLSFHTFQAMSYTIEVYLGNQKAERHFGIYSLYVMFYPQLVAGPIERPQNLLHQFHEKHYFSYEDATSGLRQMMWGMIKKVVIADRLAPVTDAFFNDPHQHSGIGLAMGAVFFAFQIYCDFSGYSDIALGAARVMGFKLMTNFNNPYSSKSISEFWSRWHISLSTWFREYVFIPLSFSLRSLGRASIILSFLITFLISGLWHGASWTLIIWGALHGIALTYEALTQKTRARLFKRFSKRAKDLIGLICTFSFVAFSCVFFRANNIRDAFYIVGKLGGIPRELFKAMATRKIAFLNLPGLVNVVLPCAALIIFLQIAQRLQVRLRLPETFAQRPTLARWGLYFGGIAVLLFLGAYTNHMFIYFQF